MEYIVIGLNVLGDILYFREAFSPHSLNACIQWAIAKGSEEISVFLSTHPKYQKIFEDCSPKEVKR